MKKLFGILLLVMLGVQIVPAQAVAQAYDDSEAYAVYSAILGNEWPIRVAKAKRLVIQAETADYPKFATQDKTCIIPAKGEESIYGPVITAYENVNKKTWLLQRKFETAIPYELVPKAAILASFEKRGIDGWQDFKTKYPDSGGFISMSAVGFSSDKTIAIVYMGHSCGGLCGGGLFHVLKKLNGTWSEIRWAGETCAWAS